MAMLKQPCNNCCDCDISVYFSDGAGGDTTLDVTGQFYIEHDLSINVTGGSCYKLTGACGGPGSSAESWSVEVLADGVSIYSTGCVTGNLSTAVTVPVGTTELRMILVTDCAGCCESGDVTTTAEFTCP